MMFGLENKSCLVTGGTKGIGKAVVQKLATNGAKVYTCSRNQTELDKTLASCTQKGWNVQGCVCDVTDSTDLEKLIKNVEDAFEGNLNVLVNNAGTYISKTFMDFSQEDFSDIMRTNLDSVYNLSKLCYPLLKASGTASIVNMGSINGGHRASRAGLNGLSKAAVHQLTRSFACEWATDNIRANCVSPGVIQTRLTQKMIDDEEALKRWMAEAPLKRVGQPEEIANAVAFFCSENSSYITGQILYVDGGYSARGLGY